MPSCLKTATMNTFPEQKEKKKKKKQGRIQFSRVKRVRWKCLLCFFLDLTKTKNTAKNNGEYVYSASAVLFYSRTIVYLCSHLHQTPEVGSVQATGVQ